MPRYADPRLCPDCRAVLPESFTACPACELPLRGPLAFELFQTLQRADLVLTRLRDSVPTEALKLPEPSREPRGLLRRTGIRTASVPMILLGLGALCLLVAAITFLAVAWSWMGIGGRTGVLVGLTAAATAAGRWLGGRGLRVAAESLTAVALGLVSLDVAGAISAGWFGSPDPGASVALVGAGVAVLASALVLTSDRLVVPQLGTTLGAWTSALGLAASTGHLHVVAVVTVLLFAVVAAIGRIITARILVGSAALAGGTWWLILAATGFDDVVGATSLPELWIERQGLPLLAAAALLLVPAAVLRGDSRVLRVGVSGAATLVTYLLALPALDESTTTVAAVSLAALLVWSSVGLGLPRAWRRVPAGPIALAAVAAVALVVDITRVAVVAVGTLAEPFTRSPGVRLPGSWATGEPLFLVPLVLALLLAARVLWRPTPVRTLGSAAVALGGVATLASYPVPLATVVGALVALAVVLAMLATGSRTRAAMAAGLAAAAAVSALPSPVLTAAACAAAVAVGVVLVTRAGSSGALSGGLLLPAAAAGMIWSLAEVADIQFAHRALPVLLVCGLLALARPRLETEVVAALAAMSATSAALDVATDQPTALAVHLTVAGVLVTASSLLHPSRRALAWPGGLLLAAATWVRLADLGVEAPEAYTLPSAVALVLVGLDRMRRSADVATAVLLPGLVLATVPSLLWVLVDPVETRAVVLGIACLGLVLGGTRLGWSAPLAVGGLVGGLLVIREVAPYASELPQWVLIGLAGTVLTTVGVTWEQRLLEMRRATTYLGRLR